MTLDAPGDDIDLEAWLFGLSDGDYQACAKGHQGAGVFADEQGRGMINVESIGGHLIVQHYRLGRADRSLVEMYSPTSRVYLFHLIPVAAGCAMDARGDTAAAPQPRSSHALSESTSDPSSGHWPGSASLATSSEAMFDEEAAGFAADIARKQHIERTPHVTGVQS